MPMCSLCRKRKMFDLKILCGVQKMKIYFHETEQGIIILPKWLYEIMFIKGYSVKEKDLNI